MIVTIDGPAGAGKSTVAQELARRLGFEFLDTGAMYRAVTLAALREGLDLTDRDAVANLVAALTLEMPPHQVVLNGEDVTGLIRTKEVTAASGAIADNPTVRGRLVEMQREVAVGRNFVCEGRDQGTIVFPDARCKFFLTADPLERARRRQQEMTARGDDMPLHAVLAAQQARDERDAARDIAPMRPAPDAILVDSTSLTLNQVVAQMEREARSRFPGSWP